jgi:hypothetical protein
MVVQGDRHRAQLRIGRDRKSRAWRRLSRGSAQRDAALRSGPRDALAADPRHLPRAFDLLDAALKLFEHVPQPLAIIDTSAAEKRNRGYDAALGLALSDDRVDYLAQYFLGEK